MISALRVLLASWICLQCPAGYSQLAADWRGAWVADVGAVRHVLYLVLRDGQLGGTYCTECNDPANLAFVDDGSLNADLLQFTLYHTSANGTQTMTAAAARIADKTLAMTRTLAGGMSDTLDFHRVPAPPPAAAPPARPPAPPRTLAAAAETLSVDAVAGLWLSGNGTNKQYFIFKRHKSGLRGLVCGPCDNPLAFAPLDNIRLEDTTLHFDIVHEDNGFGFAEHGPFRNLTQARIAMNEMLLSTVASYEPDAPPFEMTLLGPVQFRP